MKYRHEPILVKIYQKFINATPKEFRFVTQLYSCPLDGQNLGKLSIILLKSFKYNWQRLMTHSCTRVLYKLSKECQPNMYMAFLSLTFTYLCIYFKNQFIKSSLTTDGTAYHKLKHHLWENCSMNCNLSHL